MSDSRTIRILEIDGGGERGYLPLKFLEKFIQLWGIDPATLARRFDVICGTSVGGIMALALAFGLTPEEIAPFFTQQGPYIFSLTSVTPSVRPNLAAKIALILADTPFYQSSGPTAEEYGSGLLYKTLQTNFGSSTLQDLNTNVIIPAYEADTSRYVLFSNLNYPEFIGKDELISNVGLATGAAPIYLPPFEMNDHSYLDGGIFQNNPSQFGRTLGKMIKPNANRACILSLGTGLGEMGFDPGNPDMPELASNPEVNKVLNDKVLVDEINSLIKEKGSVRNLLQDKGSLKSLVSSSQFGISFNSIQTIFSLFDISSAGGQESVSRALFLESNYTLNQLYYYRFQPKLDPNLNTELDNTDPAILQYYEDVANDVFNDDIDNISSFLGHLTA